MTQKGRTPDEKFLVELYRQANAVGDPCCWMDAAKVALALGQKEIAVKNIIKHLAQANFVQKNDENMIHLTRHGCRFVEDELEFDSRK